MSDYVTQAEAARIVGCSARTIGRHLTPAGKIGQAYAYNRADVEAMRDTWINRKLHPRPLSYKRKQWPINPGSRERQRKPGHVGLYLAMQKVKAQREDLR